MRWLVVAALAAALAGCKSNEPEATKADFAKKPMPPGYHGPEGTPPSARPPGDSGGR